MISDEMHNALVNHYEHIPSYKRADWYSFLPELMAFQKQSFDEIKKKIEIWTKYYDVVRKDSPAAHLFMEWKEFAKGRGSLNAAQLLAASEELKEKGLPEIQGRPRFRDPVEMRALMSQAETSAKALLKKEEKKPKRQWED